MIEPKRVAAYVDPLSVRPGDTLNAMVSCHEPGGYDATLVRLSAGDDRPRGTGFREVPVSADFAAHYPGREQPIEGGSYCVLPDLPALTAFEFSCEVYPTTPYRDRQSIVRAPGFELRIEQGFVVLTTPGGDVQLTDAVAPNRWHALRLTVGPGSVELHQRITGIGPAEPHEQSATALAELDVATEAGAWTLAGPGFNGRLEAPRIATRSATVGAWDFSIDMAGDRVRDVSGNDRDGRLFQTPTRAVKGARWNGTTQRWSDDPAQYAAIHFHEDDLTDAGWRPDFQWRVPEDLPSGQYAVRLRSASSEDYAPFFVRPAPGRASSKIVYLAPTATYLAYANQGLHLRANPRPRNPSDAYQIEHPEIGLSLYDYHLDGSGVHYSSRLRPIMNLKPRTLTWAFNADTNVTAWLDHIGEPYDVVTDEDLHREGVALLGDYRVVVTGTHPEYYSTAMSDAMVEFLDGGGRLMYLGGNGFYWRIAYDPENPAIIEVRRAEDGTRAWMAEPGEYYHAFTGEFGGLWRRLGRPPNRIAGIGFAAQGFDGGTHYRFQAGATDPRVAFMLEGLENLEIFGAYGTQGGGAAGEEIDRWDYDLGSPAHAVIVATSEHHRPGMLRTIEEIHMTGYPEADPLVRADMVFYETPSGGAVFSTGSISYAGALSHDGYANDVERLTRNVLQRFADPAPFEYPT